jgi:hypothetical protein
MESKKLGRRPMNGVGYAAPISIRIKSKSLCKIKEHTSSISGFIRTAIDEKLNRMKENK